MKTEETDTVLEETEEVFEKTKGPATRFLHKCRKQGGRARNVARRKAKRIKNRKRIRAMGK